METVTTYDISGLGWLISLILGGVLYHFSIKMKMQDLRREMHEANRSMNDWMDENFDSVRRRVNHIEEKLDDKSDSSSKSYYNSGV